MTAFYATPLPIANVIYCLDVVHQINAVTAAAREVALIVLAAHLRTCVANAVEEHDGEAAIQEMVDVLRKTLRR